MKKEVKRCEPQLPVVNGRFKILFQNLLISHAKEAFRFYPNLSLEVENFIKKKLMDQEKNVKEKIY